MKSTLLNIATYTPFPAMHLASKAGTNLFMGDLPDPTLNDGCDMLGFPGQREPTLDCDGELTIDKRTPRSGDPRETLFRSITARLADNGALTDPHARKIAKILRGRRNGQTYPWRELQAVDARLNPLSICRPTPKTLLELSQAQAFELGISRMAFDTRVYHYPHHDPMRSYPEIASNTKAVLVHFGGAGTTTATGRNVMRLANPLRRYGISLISFDYPFHAKGPRNEKFIMDLKDSMQMFRMILKHYKAAGLPLVLSGHSMGPMLIQELLYESPKIASGALM